jgi:hypothetical protein
VRGVEAGTAASAAGSSVAKGERTVREGAAGSDPMASGSGVGRGGLGFGGGRRH